MALFTKLFERDHNPYDLKGRWYKIHLISNGTSYSIDASKSDLQASVSGTIVSFTLSANAKLIDFVLDCAAISGTTVDYVKHFYWLSNAGQLGFTVPSANRFIEIDAYLFIKGI